MGAAFWCASGCPIISSPRPLLPLACPGCISSLLLDSFSRPPLPPTLSPSCVGISEMNEGGAVQGRLATRALTPAYAQDFTPAMSLLQQWDWSKLVRAVEGAARDPGSVVAEFASFLLLKLVQRDTAGALLCASANVDAVWRAQLLQPAAYVALCGALFGRMPSGPNPVAVFDYPGPPSASSWSYALTLKLYAEVFGERPPPELWPEPLPSSRAGTGSDCPVCARACV